MYGTNQSNIQGTIVTLTGTVTYKYDDSIKADRTSLQEAIWHGVTLKGGGILSTPMDDAAWAWYNTASAAVASNPEFLNYVYVLNPGPAPPGYAPPGSLGEAQSMLYAQIPEPASLIVWSLIATISYLGVTAWRRQARG
jgi:hypothetical protein